MPSVAEWAKEVSPYVQNTRLRFNKRVDVASLRDITPLKPTYQYPEGCVIAFCPGSVDLWAAVVAQPGDTSVCKGAYATDAFYFSRIAITAACTRRDQEIFNDLKEIFDRTTDVVDASLVERIDEMSKKYGTYEPLLYNMYMHIYYGFIAEEHYQRRWSADSLKTQKTKLGKLIKMLGIHSLLIDREDIDYVCNRHKGKGPDLIQKEADKYGYKRDITWIPYSTEWDDPAKLPVGRKPRYVRSR